jgi:Domain of unknown function (DUF1772)
LRSCTAQNHAQISAIYGKTIEAKINVFDLIWNGEPKFGQNRGARSWTANVVGTRDSKKIGSAALRSHDLCNDLRCFCYESPDGAFSSVGGRFSVLAGQLALIAAAQFAGAAIYINIAEQPARLDLGDKALFTEWRSAYKRGFAMQAPLALVGSVLGLLTWWQTNDWRWLVGAVVIFANWPYTLFAIMPTNKQLQAINSAGAGSRSRMLIEQWGKLHAVRSALGFAAMLIFLWASLS